MRFFIIILNWFFFCVYVFVYAWVCVRVYAWTCVCRFLVSSFSLLFSLSLSVSSDKDNVTTSFPVCHRQGFFF